MNDNVTSVSIDELIENYRAVKATPNLLTRVEAHANDAKSTSSAWWLPACGAGLALAFAAFFLSNQTPSDPSPMMRQAMPGFSSLASVSNGAIRPSAPGTRPSFSQLRSIEQPVLPTKPVL